ncbi:MAG: winged helix-turn-helix domain-containing protein [Actinomycetota bacterium]
MVQFGGVTIDIDGRQVHLDGEPQHLEPQAFDLLAFLFAERQRVVPKHEILDAVWGDQFVSDAALTTRIKEVRRAVGDDGTRQHVIKNVRGRGYQFVAQLGTPNTAVSRPPVSTLVGRDDDVAATLDQLQRERLVTLVGPGGVGKTTLALELARLLRDRFTDGAHVVRLGRLRNPVEVVHALRLDLDLGQVGGDESSLLAAIAALDALVILDNCEHVIDEAARLVAAIDELGGDVRVLATSRERLGVHGEHVQTLAPLDRAAAVDLLRSRVARADSAYRWPSDQEPVIDRLLEMVDRLPLGIEMAAGRLPMFGPAELVDLLSDGLDVLQSPTRGREERHQTLRGLVEWSLPLLSVAARELLVSMSAFAGAMRLDDLTAVAQVDGRALAAGPLAELIDHSLVVADTSRTPTRYRLFDTVRAVVGPQRDQDLDAQHAAWVVAAVDRADRDLRTIDEPRAAARLDELVAETRVAHRWASAHDPAMAADLVAALLLYAQERQWPELAEWSAELIDEPDCAAAHLAAAAADASNRGRLDDARDLAQRALESDDVRVVASALDTLANLGLYEGNLDRVHEFGEALRALGAEHADPFVWMLGTNSISLALTYAGEVESARAVLHAGRPDGELAPTIRAWLDYADAEAALASGDVTQALQLVERAIRIGESVRAGFVVSVAQVTRLSALSRAGDGDAAAAAFVPVLRQYRFTHDVTHVVTALRNVVVLLARLGRDREAVELLGALAAASTDSYGGELADLTTAVDAITARHDADTVAAWLSTGNEHDMSWATERAIEALDGDREH